MHPKELVEHLNKIYSDETIFNRNDDFSFIHAYFHTTEERGFPIGMHSHTFYEINIIVDGSGYHYIEDQCIEVNVGDIFVLPPTWKHGYYTDNRNFKIFHILLSPYFIERYHQELSSLPGFTILFETEPYWRTRSNEKMLLMLKETQFEKILADIKELEHFENSHYPGKEVQKTAKTLYLITHFCELIYEKHKDQFDSPQSRTNSVSVVHSLEYIHNHFFEKITIDELAKIAHMSRSTYLRHFKESCNCTPQEYLTKVRVSKAIEMLRRTDLSITQISQDCGFFDSSHFSHIFYTIEGCSPSVYRKTKGYRPSNKD